MPRWLPVLSVFLILMTTTIMRLVLPSFWHADLYVRNIGAKPVAISFQEA